ncbi:MAG: hypothetical protein HZC11_02310 [Nitrospirae bacterium]|nr:hypothetical protein [Nitrospirota bacterium]
MRVKLFMLTAFLTIALTGGAVFAESVAQKEASESEIGRYQLFQGTYTSMDLKRQETSTHVGIFLLDTKTGTVKRYVNKINEQGRYIETWLPTELSSEK